MDHIICAWAEVYVTSNLKIRHCFINCRWGHSRITTTSHKLPYGLVMDNLERKNFNEIQLSAFVFPPPASNILRQRIGNRPVLITVQVPFQICYRPPPPCYFLCPHQVNFPSVYICWIFILVECCILWVRVPSRVVVYGISRTNLKIVDCFINCVWGSPSELNKWKGFIFGFKNIYFSKHTFDDTIFRKRKE